MTMLRTHKIRLNPTQAQAMHFARACGVARFAWNWALIQWQPQYKLHQEEPANPNPGNMALRRQPPITLRNINLMKFPSAISAAVLVVAMPSFSQTATGTSVAKTIGTNTTTTVFVRGFCKFGLQFIASSLSKTDTSNGGGGVAVTQVIGKDGKPMSCEEDVK